MVQQRSRHRLGYLLAWLVAAAVAITVGVVAVTTVGESVRGRGPIGNNEAIRNAELRDDTVPSPDPDATRTREIIAGDYGEFEVECQGRFAVGVQARPNEAAGWQTVSYEPGPDEDVDAVFANNRRSVELEVFCYRGVPTLDEEERKTLPADS